LLGIVPAKEQGTCPERVWRDLSDFPAEYDDFVNEGGRVASTTEHAGNISVERTKARMSQLADSGMNLVASAPRPGVAPRPVPAGCPGRIPHDFRRTAVRNLVRAGVPERVATQLTGHKTRSVFERYNITSPNDLRDAAQRLDAFEAAAR
jgi:integrase